MKPVGVQKQNTKLTLVYPFLLPSFLAHHGVPCLPPSFLAHGVPCPLQNKKPAGGGYAGFLLGYCEVDRRDLNYTFHSGAILFVLVIVFTVSTLTVYGWLSSLVGKAWFDRRRSTSPVRKKGGGGGTNLNETMWCKWKHWDLCRVSEYYKPHEL